MDRDFANMCPVLFQELGTDGGPQTSMVAQNRVPTQFGVCHISLLFTPAALSSYSSDPSLNYLTHC